jgi:hypothetical protein
MMPASSSTFDVGCRFGHFARALSRTFLLSEIGGRSAAQRHIGTSLLVGTGRETGLFASAG